MGEHVMATLPTFPTYTTDEVPAASKLNQTVTAVAFATKLPILVSLKKTATQAVSASTTTTVTWNVSEVDTDSMHSNVTNNTRITAVTQGYYKFHCTVAVNQTATAAFTSMWLKQTTGVNNPLGAGVTQIFAPDGTGSTTIATDFRSATLTSISPCLFIGDYVEAFVFSSVACNLQFNFWASGNSDGAGNADGACCLTAYYVCEGP
jgi:hypothetical protein